MHLDKFWTIGVLKERFSKKSRLQLYDTYLTREYSKSFCKSPSATSLKMSSFTGWKGTLTNKKGLDNRKDKNPATMEGNHPTGTYRGKRAVPTDLQVT